MPTQILTVLVVDDDGHDRFLISSVLRETMNYADVQPMASGQELIDWLEQQRQTSASSASSPVTVILLDMHTDTESGLDILKATSNRGELAYMPVIMLSSSVDPQIRQQAYEQGVHLFMNKPDSYRGFYRVAEAVNHCYRDVRNRQQRDFSLGN